MRQAYRRNVLANVTLGLGLVGAVPLLLLAVMILAMEVAGPFVDRFALGLTLVYLVPTVGWLPPLAGVVTGHIAQTQISRRPERGRAMSVIGLVLCYLTVLISGGFGVWVFAQNAPYYY